MNSVNLLGRVVSDVEVRKTQKGDSVARVRLAVKRPYSKDVTDFVDAVAWRANADNIAKYFGKGDLIAIAGYLVTGEYEKDGTKFRTVEVNIDSWDFCGTNKKESEEKEVIYENLDVDEDLPF